MILKEKLNVYVNNLVQFLNVYFQNLQHFLFKIWEMVEKIKMDADGLLLVLIMKKKFPIDFATIELLFILQA